MFPVLLLFFKKEHYIYTSGLFGKEYPIVYYISIDLFRWIIGLIGSIFVITVLSIVYRIKPFKSFLEKISVFGRKSLQIYVLSVVFLSAYLPKIINKIKIVPFFDRIYIILSQNQIVYDLIFTLIIALFYAVLLYFLNFVLEKMKVSKYIFGR